MLKQNNTNNTTFKKNQAFIPSKIYCHRNPDDSVTVNSLVIAFENIKKLIANLIIFCTSNPEILNPEFFRYEKIIRPQDVLEIISQINILGKIENIPTLVKPDFPVKLIWTGSVDSESKTVTLECKVQGLDFQDLTTEVHSLLKVTIKFSLQGQNLNTSEISFYYDHGGKTAIGFYLGDPSKLSAKSIFGPNSFTLIQAFINYVALKPLPEYYEVDELQRVIAFLFLAFVSSLQEYLELLKKRVPRPVS